MNFVVVYVLSAFNAWEKQVPAYGVTAIFELTQHKITKEYGVEIFLRNSTSPEPYKLNIPGCDDYCYLDRVKSLVAGNIAQNFTAECQVTGKSTNVNALKIDPKELNVYT